MSLMHACPGCGKLIAYGVRRCPACQERRDAAIAEREAEADRRREAKRRARSDPRYRAFYRSKQWRQLSAWKLASCGHVCEDCGHVACEVHHDPPIQTPQGWAHRLDPAHLHALCVRCHNARHGRFGPEAGGGRKSAGQAP